MSVRASANEIVTFVARLINDESNAYHSPDEIQDALDRYRQEARYAQLMEKATYAEGGTSSYLTFDAPSNIKWWETDAEIVDNDYTVLSPTTSDFWNGRWTFTTSQARPLRITGYYHDPYGAAADLLEVRLAMLSENYDFRTADGDSYSRSQARDGLKMLINKYRASAGAGGLSGMNVTTINRTDVNIF